MPFRWGETLLGPAFGERGQQVAHLGPGLLLDVPSLASANRLDKPAQELARLVAQLAFTQAAAAGGGQLQLIGQSLLQQLGLGVLKQGTQGIHRIHPLYLSERGGLPADCLNALGTKSGKGLPGALRHR